MHPSFYTNSPTIQTPSSDIGLAMKNMLIANASSVNLSRPHSPLATQVDGASNLKWVSNSSVQQEGFSNSYSQSFVMPSPTPPISITQQLKHPDSVQSYHTPINSYPLKAQKQGPESDLRFKQDRSSNYHSHLNQNNNNAMAGGSRQSGSSWERNDNAEGQDLYHGVQRIAQLEIIGIITEEICLNQEFILRGFIGLNGQDSGVLLGMGILVGMGTESGMIRDDDSAV